MSTKEPTARATIGPYRVVARVGAGGMGEVFKAWDPRLEREVAIKLLRPEAAGNAEQGKQLLASACAAARPSAICGIVHRDIKPENVMLARDGTARIVDFGLARVDPHAPSRAHAVAHATTVTLEGGVSGTPACMSPEQARGQTGDVRTDQFSFAALLYEMATGRPAFRRDTMAETLSAVLHDEPKPIAAINPRVPVPLIWIIEQCMAKDSGERYAATEDLARELRRVRERLRETVAEGPGRRHRPTVAASRMRRRRWTSIFSSCRTTDERRRGCWPRRETRWIRPGRRQAISMRS